MNLIKRIFNIETKQSVTERTIVAMNSGQAVWTPRNYTKLTNESYIQNVIAFRCINEIARTAAGVEWQVSSNGDILESSPLLDLLNNPNLTEGSIEFWEKVFAFLIIDGNSYLEAIRPIIDEAQMRKRIFLPPTQSTPPPLELATLRPDRMKVLAGTMRTVGGYEYEVSGIKTKWLVDELSGLSNILQIKDFHPLNDFYGLSRVEPAATSVDQHNAAGEHNASLLQNSARPSGILTYKGDKEDGARIKQRLLDDFMSPRNAFNPMVLSEDATWTETSMSPRDLDFHNNILLVSRNICAAFGVPSTLVVTGESTFNNRADARLELWEQTIIPLINRVTQSLNMWLAPMFGDDLTISIKLDNITALTPRRTAKTDQVIAKLGAGIITRNEAREALDHPKVKNGDDFVGQNNADNNTVDDDDEEEKSITSKKKTLNR